jgi:hypothetical protein
VNTLTRANTALTLVSAWVANDDPRLVIVRFAGDFYTPSGVKLPTLTQAVEVARGELAATDRQAATIASQAERIRELESSVRSLHELCVSAESDIDHRVTEAAELRIERDDWRRRAERAWVWGGVLSVLALVAGFVLGGAP